MVVRRAGSRKPKSLGAQIARMRVRWPAFEVVHHDAKLVCWVGPLRPIQRTYLVKVCWGDVGLPGPYVWLVDPPLTPRDGESFENIPHLWFDPDKPAKSGLCLFDPAKGEWASNMAIADTTLPWASDWLRHYELWHFDGVWRGAGVGPSTVAEARDSALHRP